jgi:hypothetical protein
MESWSRDETKVSPNHKDVCSLWVSRKVYMQHAKHYLLEDQVCTWVLLPIFAIDLFHLKCFVLVLQSVFSRMSFVLFFYQKLVIRRIPLQNLFKVQMHFNISHFGCSKS